jgi:4-hydroxyphenylacetate 3-monooxygenase
VGARTGKEFIDRLNSSNRDLQINGERVRKNLADHPAVRNLVRSYAELYDMQHDEDLRDVMTYESPTSGDRVGMSFLTPQSISDLERRRTMMKTWSDHSLGMLGRTGDYLNSSLMAMAAASEWFGQVDKQFSANIRAYYEHVRENDLLLTHTLINPQANRSKAAHEQTDPYLAAGIVKETDNGIIVRGARMLATLGGVADEIMVFPSTVLKADPKDEPYAYAFALPCDTPGLRFLCRESFDYGKSHFDHPLGSRFDEIDAVAIFDDVEVPYERCFMIRHPELLTRGRLYQETGALVHMTHQVVVKDLAKAEFVLGLISKLADAIKIEQFQHVQEKIAEVIIAMETLRGLTRAAEADAAPNEWGVMSPRWEPLNVCRNWFPKIYPEFVKSIWQLGAAGLFGLPTEKDVFGEASEDVEKYLQATNISGRERVRLFRLAWDASISAFAGRQEAYEFFFFGDPVRMAGALVNSYNRTPYMERIDEFLARSTP